MSSSNFDTAWKQLPHPADHPAFSYNGFHPARVTNLPKGHVKKAGFQAFPVDVIWKQDCTITMRDGIKLYGDVFRPSQGNKVPAILPYSPYGKVASGVQNYDRMGPFRMGIPYQRLSGYETFEGPNPAEWAERGYAVVDIDARGCAHSEGNIVFWGQQEAEDIYDSITWVSQQPWCNGSVVLAGHSHIPNQLCLPFHSSSSQGDRPMGSLIMGGFAGLAHMEDFAKMLQEHPMYDAYWESKNIDTKNIRDLPVYFTASYSTGLHTEGSLGGFQTATTSKKWIRIHASQEWHDLYTVEANDDLQRFFDYYAKAKTIVERSEKQWPSAHLRMERYYLDAATKSLSSSQPEAITATTHESHSFTDSSDFRLIFPEYTELSGRPFVKLFMSAPSHDDLDVIVQIRKLSASGEVLESLNWSPMPQPQPEVPNVNVAKHLGPQGMLRASHRVSMAPRVSDDEYPSYDHHSRQPITPGEIVELLIPIWPMGVVYEAGEGLMLKIAGHDMSLPEVEMLRPTEPRDENKGQHIVYTGGEYDSYLALPRIV
ncbi:hypothetical protein N7508_008298 [Penicillium antarcticum]|uniref:uncharacterized protein n=1 Tax=Penicillium antarcticum TaxID=416450 RepID=UPI002389FA9D|nr:uncharacterized protein N7508_008298 [Penicillium antarcticum]KAJ5298049.1 hypothetical protein N7508_008298 [Penicillium antarcticum]